MRRMDKMKNAAVILGLSLLTLFSCQNNKTKKVGSVLPLTGNSAEWGDMARKGMNVILEEYNANNVEKVEIIFEDSEGKTSKAVSAINKLINLDKTPIVLGGILSSTTLAMAPTANTKETVLIGVTCSSPAVTDAGDFVYRVWPSDLYEGKVFAEWVFNHNYKRIGIIYMKNDYGEGLKEAFKKRLIELGGEVPNEAFFTDQDKNYRNIITKVNSKVDAIYIVGYYENTSLIINQIRALDKNIQLFGASSSIQNKMFEIADSTASNGFIAALVNDYDIENLTERQKEFANKFKEKYGVEPDWAAVHGADAISVALDAISKHSTGADIKKYIDTKKSFDGISSDLTFDANGDVVNKPITIKIVKNNSFQNYSD